MLKNALAHALTYLYSGKSAQQRKLLYKNYKITFIENRRLLLWKFNCI